MADLESETAPEEASVPARSAGRPERTEFIDRVLTRAVLDRDPEALESLYGRHRSMVFGICMRILGTSEDAEEVLEDVFFELWRRPERFDPERGSLRAFLATMARSRSLDRTRARKRRDQTLHAYDRMSRPVETRAESPDQRLDDVERKSQAHWALAALNEREREVVELCFWHGLSHQEIASRLRQPLGTVKTRIRRGVGRLRLLLEQSETEVPSS